MKKKKQTTDLSSLINPYGVLWADWIYIEWIKLDGFYMDVLLNVLCLNFK